MARTKYPQRIEFEFDGVKVVARRMRKRRDGRYHYGIATGSPTGEWTPTLFGEAAWDGARLTHHDLKNESSPVQPDEVFWRTESFLLAAVS